jgi:hypothetical protein
LSGILALTRRSPITFNKPDASFSAILHTALMSYRPIGEIDEPTTDDCGRYDARYWFGRFIDGILFHQLLQIHNMVSARLPPVTLVNAEINMFWDGVFHAGTWLATAAGLWMLFRVGARRDVPWSGRVLLGGMVFGWGLFNFVEGVIDHHISAGASCRRPPAGSRNCALASRSNVQPSRSSSLPAAASRGTKVRQQRVVRHVYR